MDQKTNHDRTAPELLYETSRSWWFSKPPGWLSVYPTHSTNDPVLAAWVQEQTGKPVFPVHRLDRETSGVILFAKDRDFHRQASQWFQSRKVLKVYHFLALVSDLKPHAPPVWSCTDPIDGRPSETQFQLLQKKGSIFLGEARPKTGRRHQIRIHLKSSGIPILGDTEYGGSIEGLTESSRRVMLHSFRLKTPDGIDVIAPYYPDFERLLNPR